MQRRVREKLWEIHDRTKSWRGVYLETGINRGWANAIARGKQRASRQMAEKLGIHPVVKRRTPWKKKYRLLRKFVMQRRTP
jgi:hypothetical protein